MTFKWKAGYKRIVYDETPRDLPQFSPITDDNMEDHRFKGYLHDVNLEQPRYPVTGPIGFKGETKTFPLRSSLIKGQPVMPKTPAEGFVHGSPSIGKFTEADRKEKRFHLKLLEKTSADLRKIQRQQEERLQFMNVHEQQKKSENFMKKKEKEEDLAMLRSYNPFGKPGFGAPRGLGKENTTITKSLDSKEGVGMVRVKPHDLPMRAETNVAYEKPKVQRYEDDRMRRYRVDKNTSDRYRKELDALIDVKQQNEEIINKLDKKRENQMIGYDPFGKPGAGAPNRDDQGRPSTRRSISLSYVNHPFDAKAKAIIEKQQRLDMQSKGNIKMSRKYHFASPEKFTQDDTEVKENPWMKLGQQPNANKSHIRFPRAGDHGIYEFVDPEIESELFPRKHVGGGGEPLVSDSGSKLTKRVGLLTTIHGARRTENITKVATPEEAKRNTRKSPWGKPGAGAPLTNSRGEIIKNTKGRIKHESLGYSKEQADTIERAKVIYRGDLQEGIKAQKVIRDEEKDYQRLPPGDVPSWFSKGKVGRPQRDPDTGMIVPQKRTMTDVTAQKFNYTRPSDSEKYYQDLQKMATERFQKKLEERQRILQQEMTHSKAFRSFFQRPGHGAPHEKGFARRKFSNNAIMAQEQVQCPVPRVEQQATLNSVLNLHNKESSKTSLIPAIKQSTVSPPREIAINRVASCDIICKQCPIKYTSSCRNSCFKAKRTASLPYAIGMQKKANTSPELVPKERSPVLIKQLFKSKPFPYRVVAPWAVDA